MCFILTNTNLNSEVTRPFFNYVLVVTCAAVARLGMRVTQIFMLSYRKFCLLAFWLKGPCSNVTVDQACYSHWCLRAVVNPESWRWAAQVESHTPPHPAPCTTAKPSSAVVEVDESKMTFEPATIRSRVRTAYFWNCATQRQTHNTYVCMTETLKSK